MNACSKLCGQNIRSVVLSFDSIMENGYGVHILFCTAISGGQRSRYAEGVLKQALDMPYAVEEQPIYVDYAGERWPW